RVVILLRAEAHVAERLAVVCVGELLERDSPVDHAPVHELGVPLGDVLVDEGASFFDHCPFFGRERGQVGGDGGRARGLRLRNGLLACHCLGSSCSGAPARPYYTVTNAGTRNKRTPRVHYGSRGFVLANNFNDQIFKRLSGLKGTSLVGISRRSLRT